MTASERYRILGALMGTGTYDEIGFKIYLLDEIVLAHEPGATFSREELMIVHGGLSRHDT